MRQVSRALRFALAACLTVALLASTVAQERRGPGGRGPGGGFRGGPGGGYGPRGRFGGFRAPPPSPPPPAPTATSESSDEEKKGEEDGEKPDEEEGGPIFVVVPQELDGQQLISFSFDGADIDDVIKFLAEASGKIIYKHPDVETKVTIISMAKVTVADAFRVLAGLLSVKGFAMTIEGDEVRITPAAEARLRLGARVQEGKEPEEIEPGKEIITQIMQIEYVDAVKLKEDLAPLFPEDGKNGIMIANADTNTLVIIDEADNVRRIAEIIKALDRDTSEILQVEVIRLEYAEATELAELLTELFEPTTGLAGLPPEVRRRMEEAMRRGAGGGTPPTGRIPGMAQGLTQLRGQVKVAADERTNSIVVSAAEGNMESIREIVKELDVDVSPEVKARIFPLRYADATTVAEQLNQLFESSEQFSRRSGGGMFSRYYSYGSYRRGGEEGITGLQENRVVADTRTNSVIVTATEENMPAFEDLINQLDQPSQVEDVVRVFELQNAVASVVADALYDLFQGAYQGRSFFFFLFGRGGSETGRSPLEMLQEVNIVADDQSNKLLVTGPSHTFDAIAELVEALDQPQPQVFIEVVITDVTLGVEHRFGIEWTAIDPAHFNTGTSAEFGAELGLGTVEPPAGFTYSILSRNFRSLLQALESDQDVEVVSTPHIMAMDNVPATISIGEKIPYTTTAGETVGGAFLAEVDHLEVAITLNVTPHINASNQIGLEIEQVIDSFIEFVEFGPGQRAPRTQSRSAQTSILVDDGQTVVIGGIMSDRESVRVSRVPILSKIPLLGELFKHKYKEKTKTELMVFLTPHIIKTVADQQAVKDQQSGKLSRDPFANPKRQPIRLEREGEEGEAAAGTEMEVAPAGPGAGEEAPEEDRMETAAALTGASGGRSGRAPARGAVRRAP